MHHLASVQIFVAPSLLLLTFSAHHSLRLESLFFPSTPTLLSLLPSVLRPSLNRQSYISSMVFGLYDASPGQSSAPPDAFPQDVGGVGVLGLGFKVEGLGLRL